MAQLGDGAAPLLRFVARVSRLAGEVDAITGHPLARLDQRAIGAGRFGHQHLFCLFGHRCQPVTGVEGTNLLVRVHADADAQAIAHLAGQFTQGIDDVEQAGFHVGDTGAVSALTIDAHRAGGGGAEGEDGIHMADQHYIDLRRIRLIADLQSHTGCATVDPLDLPAAHRLIFGGHQVGHCRNARLVQGSAIQIDQRGQFGQVLIQRKSHCLLHYQVRVREGCSSPTWRRRR